MNNKISNEEKIELLNRKTEEMAAIQEQELVSDYDAALKEYQEKNKPYKVKFKGTIYEIPSSMPFSFGLFYMRNCIKKTPTGATIFAIPDEKISEFVELMFGKKFLEAITDDSTELKFIMNVIVPDIMDKWGYAISSEVAEKEKSERKNT